VKRISRKVKPEPWPILTYGKKPQGNRLRNDFSGDYAKIAGDDGNRPVESQPMCGNAYVFVQIAI